jgi:hypothetical protein
MLNGYTYTKDKRFSTFAAHFEKYFQDVWKNMVRPHGKMPETGSQNACCPESGPGPTQWLFYH